MRINTAIHPEDCSLMVAKSSSLIRACLVVGCVVAIARGEGWETKTATWGRSSFRVAVPSDFSLSDPIRDRGIRRSIPADNDLISSYYSAEERWSYLVVSGFRPNRDVLASRKDFVSQREIIKTGLLDATKVARAAMEDVEIRWRAAIREDGRDDSAFKLERPVLFGVVDESDEHFSTLMLTALSEPDVGAMKRTLILSSSTMIFVRGKVVTLNLVRPFSGRLSYDEIKELTRELVSRTLKANG